MLGSNPSACPDAEAGAEGWLARLSLPLLICFGFKAKNPKNELSLHRSAIWQYQRRGIKTTAPSEYQLALKAGFSLGWGIAHPFRKCSE